MFFPSCSPDTIGDCVVLASGILAPDQDGFWSVNRSHNAAWGAGRMMSLAVDMMRAALEVGVGACVTQLPCLALPCLAGPLCMVEHASGLHWARQRT